MSGNDQIAVEENVTYPITPVNNRSPVVPHPQSDTWTMMQHPNDDENDGDRARPHFQNRMLLCLLAIAVNWGTTLRIANRFASHVIRVPSLEFVSKTCMSAYNITRDERMRYSRCVESQLNQCDRKLDRTIQKEDERVRKLSKLNEDILRRIEEVATGCSQSYTTLRLALEDWTANGGEIPLHSDTAGGSASDSICSPSDQKQFNETLLRTQNTMALQTEALQISSAYSEDSTSTVVLLASAVSDLDIEISALDEYIVERAKYDVDYIDGKTQNIQDALMDAIQSWDPANLIPVNVDELLGEIESAADDIMACVSLDANARMTDGTRCDPNLATMVDEFVEDAKWKVEVLKETLYDYQDQVEEYKQNVVDAYIVAKRFYDGAKAFIEAVKSFVFWEDVGDWFDISDTDFFPIDVDFPDVDLTIESVGIFGSINAMWQTLVPKIDAFHGKLASIPQAIKIHYDDMIDAILLDHSIAVFNLISDIVPDDYDPPKYVGTVSLEIDPMEEVSSYRNKSDLFMSNTRSALGMFSGIGNQYDEDQLNIGVSLFNITEIKNKATSIDLVFEGLQQPDMDFDLWFLQLSQLSDGFVLVDYIFRAYVSIRLLMRYWFATSLAMPRIDLRANKEVNNPFRMHPARAVIAFATSPMGGFIIFLGSSTWILGIVLALYAPMLRSYTSGCVSANGNGTFITKNLFSVAYNHAYQDGSSLLIEGMDAFDLKRGDSCSSRYTSSATLQNGMSSNFSAYASFHRELSKDMGLAQRCVDANALDTTFREACCGFATYPDCTQGNSPGSAMCPMDDRRTIMDIPIPHALPGLSLADPLCSIITNGSDWIIEDAVVDCEQLGTCSITCPGPRKRLLKSASERCGCTMEWYLHSKWMGSTFALLLYVFMNVARVTFFSGITRLLWKYIYPERFTLLATCDSDGSLVTTSSKVSGTSHEDLISAIQTRSKADASVNTQELSRELHAKLRNCLRSFYTTGVALLLGSVFANGVW
eukprot:CAMPEP_0201663870 /NCGR_PEP_ID=MMETSP0494-20130426/5522_1 /ASSEMBLY_ACC=CAM_ASM_000839 /TAXON_ID=420259 /ORGANISM="Thalassiosira gravida, Strain GMp14c1" /LENGTH=991 /DNA_ID=CAMNT_0048142543 /DNA_START=479 /DNA_END=3451 /DNA_ORIENTATION=+